MKIDCHSHVSGRFFKWGVALKKLVEAADKLGIDKLCCSISIVEGILR
ncbi:MAG: hypothetical protein FGF51_01960 [Candidatus Brockarchaeota archaeon]|nr:hypothetical protein [Candidatus Brockarchaeota archaeon]